MYFADAPVNAAAPLTDMNLGLIFAIFSPFLTF
jgi:hypothetical protein